MGIVAGKRPVQGLIVDVAGQVGKSLAIKPGVDLSGASSTHPSKAQRLFFS